MGRIDINGKFLGAPLNGVHRTAAHYASLLIEHGRAAGHEVRLLSPQPFAQDPEFPLLVPEVHPGRFGKGQGWEMLTLPRLARGALLVNFCNLAPVLHSRSVVMIHDAQTFLYPADYSGRQATAYRMLLPLIAARALRVLTVSEFSRASLAQHRVGRLEKIDVVYNGTDHILRVPPEREILARHRLKDGAFILALGSTKGYKNIARVFEAVRASAPGSLRLVVAGGPDEVAYRDRGLNIPEGTVFTGFIPDGALRALFESAALFAFPSLTEGFGLPPLEAMHCGTPVVAASVGAMPEVCDGGAVLVDPQDTQSWCDAFEVLLSDPNERGAMVARGRARAAQFSWEAAGARLWEVLAPLA